MSSNWNEFIKAVVEFKGFSQPWMAELIVAQSIIESGRGTTPLALNHYNFNGMKYRTELAKFGGTKFQYFTSSEPYRDAAGKEVPEGTAGAKQWDWFFDFKSYQDAITTWANWWKRAPYPKVIANDPAVMKNLNTFLNYVGPIYCPYFTASHSESYADYIIGRCVPEARAKMDNIRNNPNIPTPVPPKAKKNWMVNAGHAGSAGARGKNPSIKEEVFNALQAGEIKRIVNIAGIPCDIVNQDKYGGLSGVGKESKNYYGAIALHYNATRGIEYGTGYLGGQNKPKTMAFANKVCAAIAKQFGYKNLGHIDMSVTVTSEFDKSPCTIGFLLESEFIDDEMDAELFKADVLKQAAIVAQCIIDDYNS